MIIWSSMNSKRVSWDRLKVFQIIRYSICRNITSVIPKPAKPTKRRFRPFILCGFSLFILGTTGFVFYQEKRSQRFLSSGGFLPYTLISKHNISPSLGIFTLVPKDGASQTLFSEEMWDHGIWSLQVKQPELQVVRSYTPLPCFERSDSTQAPNLRLLIRKEENGEVSSYLHHLSAGTTLYIRGPQVEMAIPSNVEDVVFLAGGTGIAPALQTAYTLTRRYPDSSGKSRLRILWANRNGVDCIGRIGPEIQPTWFNSLDGVLSNGSSTARKVSEVEKSFLVRELETLVSQFNGSLSVDYFVDDEKTFITRKTLQKLFHDIQSARGSHEKKLVLVSGPDGFVSYLAGPKLWRGGKEVQGPLGGLLGEVLPSSWEVLKL